MTDPRDEIELSPFGNEVVDLPATAVGTDPLQDARPDLAAGDGLTDVAPHRSFRKDAWARFRRNKLAMGGLVVVVLLVLVALFAPLIAPYGYDQIGPDLREGPSSTHWFGTDNIGRDVFSRVVYGARVSLVIGVLAILIDTVIGVTAGAVAAWYLWAEHRAHLLGALPYLILLVCPLMHVFMHRGHHGRHHEHDEGERR